MIKVSKFKISQKVTAIWVKIGRLTLVAPITERSREFWFHLYGVNQPEFWPVRKIGDNRKLRHIMGGKRLTKTTKP